jgi:hypothetical protein
MACGGGGCDCACSGQVYPAGALAGEAPGANGAGEAAGRQPAALGPPDGRATATAPRGAAPTSASDFATTSFDGSPRRGTVTTPDGQADASTPGIHGGPVNTTDKQGAGGGGGKQPIARCVCHCLCEPIVYNAYNAMSEDPSSPESAITAPDSPSPGSIVAAHGSETFGGATITASAALLGDALGAHIAFAPPSAPWRDPVGGPPPAPGAGLVPLRPFGRSPFGDGGRGRAWPEMAPPQMREHGTAPTIAPSGTRRDRPDPASQPDLLPAGHRVPPAPDGGSFRAETIRPGAFVAPADATLRSPMASPRPRRTIFAGAAVPEIPPHGESLWTAGPEAATAVATGDTEPALGLEFFSPPLEGAGDIFDEEWARGEWEDPADDDGALAPPAHEGVGTGDPVLSPPQFDRGPGSPGRGSGRQPGGVMFPPEAPGLASGVPALAPPLVPGDPEPSTRTSGHAPARRGPYFSLGGGAKTPVRPPVGDRSELPGGKATPGFADRAELARSAATEVLLQIEGQDTTGFDGYIGPNGADALPPSWRPWLESIEARQMRDITQVASATGNFRSAAISMALSARERRTRDLNSGHSARLANHRNLHTSKEITNWGKEWDEGKIVEGTGGGERNPGSSARRRNEEGARRFSTAQLERATERIEGVPESNGGDRRVGGTKEALHKAEENLKLVAAVSARHPGMLSQEDVEDAESAVADAKSAAERARRDLADAQEDVQQHKHGGHARRVAAAKKAVRYAKAARKEAKQAAKRLKRALKYGAPKGVVRRLEQAAKDADKEARRAERRAGQKVDEVINPPDASKVTKSPDGSNPPADGSPPPVEPAVTLEEHFDYGDGCPKTPPRCQDAGCNTCGKREICVDATCHWDSIPLDQDPHKGRSQAFDHPKGPPDSGVKGGDGPTTRAATGPADGPGLGNGLHPDSGASDDVAAGPETRFAYVELPGGGRLVEVGDAYIYIPKDMLDEIFDPEVGEPSMAAWEDVIDILAARFAAPSLDDVMTADEAELRIAAAIEDARETLVDMYTIRKDDARKLAEIYSHEVAEMFRAHGGEWIPVVDTLLEIESGQSVLRDPSASLEAKLGALGSVVLSVLPGGGAAKKGTKLTRAAVRKLFLDASREAGAKAMKHGGRTVTLLKLGRWSYRVNLMRKLGLDPQTVRAMEAHHALPQEFVDHWARAIHAATGLPIEVGERLIHHPRFVVFVSGTQHRGVTGPLRQALGTMADKSLNARPPSLAKLVNAVLSIHAKAGIHVDFS